MLVVGIDGCDRDGEHVPSASNFIAAKSNQTKAEINKAISDEMVVVDGVPISLKWRKYEYLLVFRLN